jgi:electron transfer flavoprotein alpha subunit
LDIYDDRAKAINHGLLVEGNRVAGFLGGSLTAIIEEPSGRSHTAWVKAVQTLLDAEPFRLLLLAHTDRGSERAPLIAQALGTASVTDCFDIRFRNDTPVYAKYVYGGRFEQEVTFSGLPEIASFNVEALEAHADSPGPVAAPRKVYLHIPEAEDGQRTIARIPPDFRTMDIRHAKRILDIGAGCNRPELLELAEELSNLLEASIGTTRLVVDTGRISKSRMIGQTGKEVSPDLCLTLGVSGSPHHVEGLGKSGVVLSVNSDARAPVFGVSDEGFVSDLNRLLPKLIGRIKQYRDENLT